MKGGADTADTTGEATVAQAKPESTFDRIKERLTARVIIGIVIAVLAVILIAENSQRVQFHLFFWHMDRPAWVMFLILFAAGFIVGSLFPWFNRRRKTTSDSPSSKK